MIQIYCPKCLAFTPLLFDEPYHWEGTAAMARNVVCPQCQSALSIFRGDGIGAHALQKIAELAYYALPIDPTPPRPTPTGLTKRSNKATRRLKLVP